MENFNLFKENILFHGTGGVESPISEDEIWKVFNSIALLGLQEGELVFSKGDKGDSIYLVIKGEVGVFVEGEEKKEIEVAAIRFKDFVGELAIIDDVERMATIKAKTPVLLASLSNRDFWELFKTTPEIAKNILQVITKRFRKINDELIDRIKMEKDELAKFNKELEKEVEQRTAQLREKDLQLLEKDRIVGVCTLAAGIAHEINNPLGFVKSSLNTLEKGFRKLVDALSYWENHSLPEDVNEEYKQYIVELNIERFVTTFDAKYNRVKSGIERIKNIVSSLKEFSAVDKEVVGDLDINKRLKEVVDIIKTTEKKDIEFVTNFAEVPLLRCANTDINQCFLQIVKNSVEAIKECGEIKIATTYNKDERSIDIVITDNGKGMTEELQRQVFNPFFTTKPVGSGTGVGLSIAERIINKHKGEIYITSRENEGTNVFIKFPVFNN